MYPSEWRSFMQAIEERRLPSGFSWRAVRALVYRFRAENQITCEQWTEFCNSMKRLDPAMSWPD